MEALYKRKEFTVIGQEQSRISQEERGRIQKDWEKIENKEKLEESIKIFGEYKKVVDQETCVGYRVPTRNIITKGLRQKELHQYPIWKDE